MQHLFQKALRDRQGRFSSHLCPVRTRCSPAGSPADPVPAWSRCANTSQQPQSLERFITNVFPTASFIMLMLRQDELPRQARDKRSTTETLDDAKTKRAVGGRFVCWLTAAPRSAKKRISPFELSLCLSRACLGKSIIFSIKWRKRDALSYLLTPRLARLVLHQRHLAQPLLITKRSQARRIPAKRPLPVKLSAVLFCKKRQKTFLSDQVFRLRNGRLPRQAQDNKPGDKTGRPVFRTITSPAVARKLLKCAGERSLSFQNA